MMAKAVRMNWAGHVHAQQALYEKYVNESVFLKPVQRALPGDVGIADRITLTWLVKKQFCAFE
jgi:hypothetical protein